MNKINPNSIRSFFNNFAKNYDTKAFNMSMGISYLSNIEKEFILRSCNIKKGDKVLDLGVGTGRNIERFLEKGAHIYGLDISKEMINKTKKKFKNKNIDLINRDISKGIPFDKSTFDYAICIRVLKYIPLWEGVIKESARVMKGSGIFIIEIPNKYSISCLGLSKANYILFNQKKFIKILKDNHFEVINQFYGTKLPFIFYSKINSITTLNIIRLFEKLLSLVLGNKFARNKIYACKKTVGNIKNEKI